MKQFINKIGLFVVCATVLLCGSITAKAQQMTVSTNNPVNLNSVLLTNACKIAQIQILAGASGTVVDLYDNSITNMTVTNASYTNFISYITNLVTTTSGLTSTNSTTNSVLYTTGQVVASTTNAPLPFLSFPCQASTLATYPINKLQAKGIAIRVSNTNCSIIVRYRTP